MTTGEVLRELIVDCGLTFERAARYLGISEDELMRYCLGDEPLRRHHMEALRRRRQQRLMSFVPSEEPRAAVFGDIYDYPRWGRCPVQECPEVVRRPAWICERHNEMAVEGVIYATFAIRRKMWLAGGAK